VLGLLVDRRWHLVSTSKRPSAGCTRYSRNFNREAPSWVCRSLEAAKLVASLRPVTTVDVERKQIARELVEDWRWLHKRIPDVAQRIRDPLAAHGCTLTQIYGIGDVGAATIISIVGDVRRFPTRGHFAAFNGHRAAGRLFW
jgi:transposase